MELKSKCLWQNNSLECDSGKGIHLVGGYPGCFKQIKEALTTKKEIALTTLKLGIDVN